MSRHTVLLTLFAISICPAARVSAAINVILTVQEALYPGSTPGVVRTLAPVTVGVPLPDDPATGAMNVSELSLSGAPAGQFRVLGRWPSGRIKWVLVDTLTDLKAGGQTSSIALTSGGTGNFGGPDLAFDNGSTITIGTGAATFTVRKANFNGLDQVVVGSTTIIGSGASSGFVVTGPAAGKTNCGICQTLYSSANDARTTAVIEENGPVRAVIRASGSHADEAGNHYMKFTARLFFYKNATVVKIQSILRNADYGPPNSFASAFKGMQAYELRLAPTLSGPATFAIGNHTATPTTGTLAGGDSVILYQGESRSLKSPDWCGFGCVPYTTDTGYAVSKNGSDLLRGSDTQYPAGWADVRGANGAGLSIGVYQLAAYWPKSLEFNSGGADVRVGIWPRENSRPYYQAWPQTSTHDLYIDFHAFALSSAGAEFLKFQHPLLARAPFGHYNRAGVFPYPLLDPAIEDRFYKGLSTAAIPATISSDRFCCIQDLGLTSWMWPLTATRYYAWHSGGGAHQSELRWSSLLTYLSRGMTGRYLDAAHFYRFQADAAWPHSDGFNWRDRTGELDNFGFPSAGSANATFAFRDWLDQEHGHWYGMPDYYFLSGDEQVKDAMLDGVKDWFLNPNTYQNGLSGGLWNSRAVGVELIGATRFSRFLAAIGDPDAAGALAQGVTAFNIQVKPELCVSGYPEGCVLGKTDGGPWNTEGISRTRGIPWGVNGTSGTWCGAPHDYRVAGTFQAGILIQGLLELRSAKGPTWPDYWTATDLAYGVSRWATSEMYVDSGTGRWDDSGFRYYVALDTPSACDSSYKPAPQQTVSMIFLAKYLVDGTTNDWATKFKLNLVRDAAALGMTASDFGSYQPAAVISVLSNPTAPTLVDTPLAGFTDNGGGSYTLSWMVPTNAQSYRIKWASKRIVDWIGFDAGSNTFTGNPQTTMAWFAANNVSPTPPPGISGTAQTVTIHTGVPGLKPANMSVKTYVRSTARVSRGVVHEAPTSSADARRIPQDPIRAQTGATTSSTSAAAQATRITWIRQRLPAGSPGYNGYLSTHYDPVSRQLLHYGVLYGSASIYSTDIFFYNASGNVWTHVGGTGSQASACPDDTDVWPGNRHPVGQMSIDTKRHVLWLFGGVCQGVNRRDMYYLTLNADPRLDTWHPVPITNFPTANQSSTMVYDPDDDLLFLFGSDLGAQRHNNWVYCSTMGSSGRRALTARQQRAGCKRADDWNEVFVAHGIRPPGVAFSGMVYDTITRKVIQFGRDTGGSVHQNEIWTYDVPSRTWTRRGLATVSPPVYSDAGTAQPAMAYDSATNKLLYHQTSNTGAPADWQYDPVTDRWTRLASSGGPVSDLVMAYDEAHDILIGFTQSAPGTGIPEVWHGVLR